MRIPSILLLVWASLSALPLAAQGFGSPVFSSPYITARDPTGAIIWARTMLGGSFGTPGAFQPALASCHFISAPFTCVHGYITKIDSAGQRVWSTYLGGSGTELITSVALDADGNVWVAGQTVSSDFPVTDHSQSGGIFLSELSSDGSKLLYSTCLGDVVTISTNPVTLTTDQWGGLYLVGGNLKFGSFPNTGPYTPSGLARSDILSVLKFDTRTKSPVYLSWIGPGYISTSTGDALTDDNGVLYIAGHVSSTDFPATEGTYSNSLAPSTFVAALSADGTTLLFSARFGGLISGMRNFARDQQGNLYLASSALAGSNLPVTPDAAQSKVGSIYLMKLSPDASKLLYATFLGSAAVLPGRQTLVWQIKIGADGKVNLLVHGYQWDIPLTPDSYHPCYPQTFDPLVSSDELDIYVYVRFSEDLRSVEVATTMPSGYNYYPLYFDTAGLFYMSQGTGSQWYSEFDLSHAPGSGPLCMAESVTHSETPVSPGLLVSIYGPGLGSDQPAAAPVDSSGLIGTQLAGVQVLFDGLPAPILSTGPSRIDAVVPFGIASSGNTQVSVYKDGQLQGTLTNSIMPVGIRLFSTDGTGNGPVAWNQDGMPNSAAHPAKVGDYLTFYGTGAGTMTPQQLDGLVPSQPQASLTAQVSLRSAALNSAPLCNITYAGDAPGLVEGIFQMNCQLGNLPVQQNPSPGMRYVNVCTGSEICLNFERYVLYVQ